MAKSFSNRMSACSLFSLRGWREKMAVLRLLTMHRNEFEDCQDTLISRGNRIARVTIQCRKLVVGVLGVPLWVLTNAQPDWCKELMRHSEFLPVPHLRGIQPLPSWRGAGIHQKDRALTSYVAHTSSRAGANFHIRSSFRFSQLSQTYILWFAPIPCILMKTASSPSIFPTQFQHRSVLLIIHHARKTAKVQSACWVATHLRANHHVLLHQGWGGGVEMCRVSAPQFSRSVCCGHSKIQRAICKINLSACC